MLDYDLFDKRNNNKQGYLIVVDGRVTEIIWDDGIVFFDGILGEARRESGRKAGKESGHDILQNR
tara:strand:+ start:15 stop:209 length:195 start_codon:yes stop_codon:yes gene_type:complete